MKPAMLVTDCGPLLVSTTCGSLAEPRFSQTRHDKTIEKFIAGEVPLNRRWHLHPRHFYEQQDELHTGPSADVLAIDARRIFVNLRFAESGATLPVDRQALASPETP
jgi:hypothetical protein